MGSILYEKEENNFSQYIIYSTALSLSYASLGLIGLCLTFLKLTFVPLYIILLFCLLAFLSIDFYRKKIKKFSSILSNEINLILFSNFRKPIYVFYLIILFLILIFSIGPINHSDTANTYVGYPFQFFTKNQHFISGDLNQGLLGIGDFANIFSIRNLLQIGGPEYSFYLTLISWNPLQLYQLQFYLFYQPNMMKIKLLLR